MNEQRALLEIISILDDHIAESRDSFDTLDSIMDLVNKYQQSRIDLLKKREITFKKDYYFEETSKETLIKIYDLLNEVIEELIKAQKRFKPFFNSHEGIAVIREEYLELEKEVFKNQYKYPERIPNMRAEAIQLGSMAIRLILDICDNPNSWENSIHQKKESESKE